MTANSDAHASMTNADDTPTTNATDAATAGDDSSTEPTESRLDFETVRARGDVPVRTTERTFERDSFEALRERYDAIAGVVQVGVVADGAVLLAGDDVWSPLGGEVLPGEDWAAAVREVLEPVLGRELVVERPVGAVEGRFVLELNPDGSFTAPTAFFAATLAEADESFRENPRFPADLDHPMYGDGFDLGWFESVPEDVHSNHVEDVELLLDAAEET